MDKKYIIALLILLATLATCSRLAATGDSNDWPHYNGDPANTHYSPLTQINRKTVKNLKKVWEVSVGQLANQALALEFSPLIIDGVAYLGTGNGGLVAVLAASGAELWRFSPDDDSVFVRTRGVAFWQGSVNKGGGRLFLTCGRHLYAIDSRTGTKIIDFGHNGRIDLGVKATSPGIIFKDNIIMGSGGGARGNGQVRAYDVKTGATVWTFNTIPAQPGDQGYETWGERGAQSALGANSWAGMAVDHERAAVYFSTAQPKTAPIGLGFFNGGWPGKNRFSSSVIALNAATGALLWDFQETYHDIWDYDIPAPPNLVTVQFRGENIEAVAQVTKRGNTLLLNRDTGQLLYPATEHPAPQSPIPEEEAYPTQLVFTRPEPFAKIAVDESDLTDLSPEAHEFALQQFRKLRSGWFQPPSLEGTVFFGANGGAEWGGAAYDPRSHILFVSSNHTPIVVKLAKESSGVATQPGPAPEVIDSSPDPASSLYKQNCAACHGTDRRGGDAPSLTGIGLKLSINEIYEIVTEGRSMMPPFRAILSDHQRHALSIFLHDQRQEKVDSAGGYTSPYTFTLERFVDHEGYPGTKPPWATLNAINLDTGKIIWRVPLGEHEELIKRGIPPTGRGYWGHFGGSVATAGGLLFIAATAGDKKLRAFDVATGKLLWSDELPFDALATPATYAVDGKQYILIAAGGGGREGNPRGDRYIAYALDHAE